MRVSFLPLTHTNIADILILGTAIETPIKVNVRLTVVKNKPYVETPHFLTSPAPSVSHTPGEEYYTTTGVGPGKQLMYIVMLPVKNWGIRYA